MKYLIKLINNNAKIGYIKNGESQTATVEMREEYEVETSFFNDGKIVSMAITSIVETYNVISDKKFSNLGIEEKIDILEKSLCKIFGDKKIKINKIKDAYIDTELVI